MTMASSNIKLFDENKGNMLSDSEFSISNQRMNGLQTGIASSQLQNKAMYQASLVAYAIAQIMMQNGKNANDTDAVSAFVANLSGTMLQKVYDLATTAEAQAGVATGKWMSPALVKTAIDTLAAKSQNILSDTTKALYGLGADAVPDDAFRLAIQSIPSPYGILAFRVLDTNGNPRQVACTVSPDVVSGSIVYTDSDGWFRGLALPGTYSISVIKNVFVTEASSAQQITVVAGSIRNAKTNFSITFAEHNTVKITESVDELFVPGDITSLDLFGVGGGASGAVGGGTTTNTLVVAGGGSGYTETILGRNCARKRLKVQIGAGGEPVNVNYSSDYRQYANGKAGGKTTITEYEGTQGTIVLSANGAPASHAGYTSYDQFLGEGGSCGGGGYGSTTATSSFDGAADGKSNNEATPQGTTTRAFGETDGELFASGGGGASIGANYAGVGGEGAGAAKKVATSSSSSKTVVGEDATSYGSGGGAALGRAASNVKHSLDATSGAGMQGLVMLRW